MTDGLVLMVATDAFISAGTTSPRKRRHEARYWESGPRGSHLIMELDGSKAAAVICGVVCCSWPVLPLEMTSGNFQKKLFLPPNLKKLFLLNLVIIILETNPQKKKKFDLKKSLFFFIYPC